MKSQELVISSSQPFEEAQCGAQACLMFSTPQLSFLFSQYLYSRILHDSRNITDALSAVKIHLLYMTGAAAFLPHWGSTLSALTAVLCLTTRSNSKSEHCSYATY